MAARWARVMLGCLLLLLGADCAVHRCARDWWAKDASWMKTMKIRRAHRCPVNPRGAYDRWMAEWTCDDMQRLPWEVRGDGPKWMCSINTFQDQVVPPLVYSMGCDGDIRWETMMREHFPNAEIHIFDPSGYSTWLNRTLKALEPLKATLHQWWVQLRPATAAPLGFPVMTVPQILWKLGHQNRVIDFLKVDIEGSEWSMFREVMANCSLRFRHMNIELHGTRCDLIDRFFEDMDRCGYRIAYKEGNHWGCDGYSCVEYTLISAEFACRSFAKAHHCPPCSKLQRDAALIEDANRPP